MRLQVPPQMPGTTGFISGLFGLRVTSAFDRDLGLKQGRRLDRAQAYSQAHAWVVCQLQRSRSVLVGPTLLIRGDGRHGRVSGTTGGCSESLLSSLWGTVQCKRCTNTIVYGESCGQGHLCR